MNQKFDKTQKNAKLACRPHAYLSNRGKMKFCMGLYQLIICKNSRGFVLMLSSITGFRAGSLLNNRVSYSIFVHFSGFFCHFKIAEILAPPSGSDITYVDWKMD